MLAIRLPIDIENRLAQLAKKTGRTKTYFAREAILNYLEDMEDYYSAVAAIKKPGKRYSSEEVRKELGLED
jgi:RHH-type rel operon transcriptional repressor/antitoxin RelB